MGQNSGLANSAFTLKFKQEVGIATDEGLDADTLRVPSSGDTDISCNLCTVSTARPGSNSSTQVSEDNVTAANSAAAGNASPSDSNDSSSSSGRSSSRSCYSETA